MSELSSPPRSPCIAPPRAGGPGARGLLRAAGRSGSSEARRAPTARAARARLPLRRTRRCSPPSPPPDRWSRGPTRRPTLAAAWDALRAASAAMDAGGVRRRIPRAVRRRGQERGQPPRVALPRAAVGTAAGRDPRDAGAARARARTRRAASSKTISSVAVRNDAACWSPAMASGLRPTRRAARVLRAASDAVGVRLLHCNNANVLLPTTTVG